MILSDEQEMIRDSLRGFVRKRIAPFAAAWDRDHAFPREALKEMAELGLMGMLVPEEWGGSGADYVSFAL
ncbi:MAG TPA: acyl-CoA dehydrogenase family protein, partial [Burkholderiales bacterium]